MITRRKEFVVAWNDIEQGLPMPGSLDYQHAWGTAREAFYKKIGHIPCPHEEIERLRSLKGVFESERIFVIGNGPSLNKTPLNMLENDFTFMTNRAYLLYDRISWRPSFYTATDWQVVPDIAHEINLLTGTICFFEERFRGLLRDDDDVFWYTHSSASSLSEKVFAYDIGQGVRGAGSVIGTAIQIAFFLGFREIYLIGCDLGYRVNKTVLQEGEDIFGTGTKLLLTSTEDDDPNHFDKRYFGAGRRWHDPNVKRMISGHEQCKTGVEAGGGKIFNATIGGELEVYTRVDFDSLFPKQSFSCPIQASRTLVPSPKAVDPIPCTESSLSGPYLRCEKMHLDETNIIYDVIRRKFDVLGVMIDVGAHTGTSCINFLDSGWHVFAFEPDEVNRSFLIKRTRASRYAKRMHIDQRAVGKRNQSDVAFFRSEQSSGISGLSAFHPSHSQSYTVDIVSLTDYLHEKELEGVNFLKIDTEGHDFFVLQGFPWERFKPAVIECEFEDSKTVQLGYTFHDMAGFLTDKGYKVYVSEWHPIVRYGIRHNWKCLMRYPCELTNEKAWGNLLAFRDPIDDTVVVDAVKKELKFYGAGGSTTKTISELQAGRADSGFQFRGIVYNGKVFQKHDSYKLQPPSGKNWVVCKYQGNVQAGDTVAGNVNFCVDTDCKLKLMLCRDGNTFFESSVKRLSLSKGQYSMPLSHQFKKAHHGVRIQIGVEDKKVKISDIKSELKSQQSKQSKLSFVKRKSVPKHINIPNAQKLPDPSAQRKKQEAAQIGNNLFIIGNGSSLHNFDFQWLRNVNFLGMNSACRHWRTTGIYPEYYICLDTVVIVSLKDEIYELIHKRKENGIQIFFLRKKLLDFYPELKSIPEVIFFEDYFKSPYFEGLTSKITTGSFAALFGAMLGYKQIYLLGIDLDYVQQIPEAEKVEGHVLEITRTPMKNPNYFFDDYQRKGDRFHVPDAIPNLHYQSWVMVKERLERFGVHVLNCNPKSRLDIFDYADINDILSR